MKLWFRVYIDLVDDPKAQMLPDALFRALINLWCLAAANGGLLPPVEEIAFKLRMKPDRAYSILGELRKARLLDDSETGTRPHNWDGRQFRSDTSNERVKRHRERRRNVTGNGEATPPDNRDRIQNVVVEERARDFDGELNALRSAAGPCLNPTAPALEHLAEVSRWRAGGADFNLDVLPTIAAVGKSAKRRSINSWAYFTQAIADARERRLAPMPAASPSPANGISEHEPRKPTGVSAVARRLAGEFREQERMASAEIVQLPSSGRG